MSTTTSRNLRLRIDSNLTANARYFIYGLVDPVTTELRYIGQTRCGVGRVYSHTRPSSLSKNYPVHSWIKSVHARGLEPSAILIEQVESTDGLNEAEQHYIAYFKGLGCRLTNLDRGGAGLPGFKHTPATKQKMSIARKGKAHAAEWSKRISDTHKKRYGRVVIGTGPSGEVVKVDAIIEVAGHGFVASNVRSCLAGNAHTHKGYTWRYE